LRFDRHTAGLSGSAHQNGAQDLWLQNSGAVFENLWRDLKYGLRSLRRAPSFAFVSVLVIALGIGANVALFTVVQSVLLKPLPFRDPSRLFRLYERTLDDKFPFNNNAAGVFAEWKKQSRNFSGLGIYGDTGYNLSGTQGQLPESIRAAVCSWNLMPLLGVQPALGRLFTEDDDRPSANGTVILSWGLWKRRFGASPSILNRTISLDAKPYTVIGVMPASFAFPSQAVQLWTPIYHDEPAEELQALDSHDFQVVGRLRPGVTQTAAVAELSVITRRLHNENADDPFVSAGANTRPLLDSIVGDIRTPLYILLGATGCVLLIACLNVANLLVARSAARRKELAIRTALGGSRTALLRQHLTESFLLAGGGGAMGLLLAGGIVQWFVNIRQDVPRVEAIHVDPVTIAFTLALIALSALFATLISSFSNEGGQVLAWLQESSRSHSAGYARTRLRKTLLSLEVGVTVVLLIAAGLLLKSYAKLSSTNLGCITQNVLTMNFTLPEARYNERTAAELFEALLTHVRGYPGVESAGLVSPLVPGDGYGGDNGFAIVGHAPSPVGHGQFAIHRWVDPGYFSAIGIPLTSGHTFDDNQQVGHATEVLISDSFERQYFAGQNPIGQHLMTWGNRPYEIVGVVGDTRFDVAERPQPMMYFPLYASPAADPKDFVNSAALVVRSRGEALELALPIEKIFQQLDSDLPVSDILTMDQVIGLQTLGTSFDTILLLTFAAVSLILAAVGLFGVLSYLVAQRTTEIGVRLALGAQREQVIALILIDGLRPALFGLGLGVMASAAVARVIQSMLYGTEPLDPLVFGAVACTLLFVAGLACWVPAWRASRMDPVQALRAE
jgi:predicted permease